MTSDTILQSASRIGQPRSIGPKQRLNRFRQVCPSHIVASIIIKSTQRSANTIYAHTEEGERPPVTDTHTHTKALWIFHFPSFPPLFEVVAQDVVVVEEEVVPSSTLIAILWHCIAYWGHFFQPIEKRYTRLLSLDGGARGAESLKSVNCEFSYQHRLFDSPLLKIDGVNLRMWSWSKRNIKKKCLWPCVYSNGICVLRVCIGECV